MRAMILAAGRGGRLMPLTENCPKPLIPVAGKPLIIYHLEKLAPIGITDVVINIAYLGEQIQEVLGDGRAWDLRIHYSLENPVKETGGGIFQALPLLGDAPFMIVNGDIWTDYAFVKFPKTLKGLGHLMVVDNPAHNEKGDFGLLPNGLLCTRSDPAHSYTYGGIALLHPDLFKGCPLGEAFRLAPLLFKASDAGLLSGEHYAGRWTDVGTVERLNQLNSELSSKIQVF